MVPPFLFFIMKKILLLSFLLLSIIVKGQDQVSFKLTQTGFCSNDGKDYIVVPFEGKNAHDIFLSLCSNINSLYKNPKNVMSVVGDTSISIIAYDEKISSTNAMLGMHIWLGGYYNLVFQIKDGRVRVSAPIIDEELTNMANSQKAAPFSSYLKSWFKKGEVKEKSKKHQKHTEDNMNSIINSILFYQGPNEDNW